MIRLLRSLAAVLVAVLFGFVSPAAAVQPPGAPATGHTYTFVSSLYELPPRCPSPERGPPTDGIELTVAAFQHAVGRGSDGASARSCGYAATPAYDYAATDELSYTDTSQHGQVGAREQSGAVSLHRSQVAAKSADKGIDIFRHVGPGELADLQKSGVFRSGAGSMEGKWFAESAEHAGQWGQVLNGGRGAVVTTRVPTPFANNLFRLEKLDGIGPARYADDLPLLNRVMTGVRVLP